MQCVLNPGFWIYLIFLVAAIMIIRLALPAIIAFFGFPPLIAQILMIVLWAIIAAAGVVFLFGLFSCLFPGGFAFPTFPSSGRRSELSLLYAILR